MSDKYEYFILLKIKFSTENCKFDLRKPDFWRNNKTNILIYAINFNTSL